MRAVRQTMIRPGVTLALWLAIATLVVANDAIGDTWIAAMLPARTVEWYKVLVPLPYVALISIIHARRTQGPQWLQAAVVASSNWPPSMMAADYFYGRFTFGEDLDACGTRNFTTEMFSGAGGVGGHRVSGEDREFEAVSRIESNHILRVRRNDQLLVAARELEGLRVFGRRTL